jgi:4'-phosphopantetheinyl transferase
MLPQFIDCKHGEVQLRWTSLDDCSPDDILKFFNMLTPEEQAHVESAKTQVEKETRIVARGVLREELAARTGLAPQVVQLENTAGGKPILCHQANTDIHFNLTHSHGWILHAFARGFEVGVDIEHMNPAHIRWELVANADRNDLARHDITDTQRTNCFYRQWVSQEAVLKAAGCGMTQFEAVIKEWVHGDDELWQVIEIPAPPGFAAALALPQRSPTSLSR